MSQEEVFAKRKAKALPEAREYISTGNGDKENKDKIMAAPKKKVVLVHNT